MKTLKKVWEFLSGKKTYLIAACGVVWGIFKGDIEIVLAALALVGLRDALEKVIRKE